MGFGGGGGFGGVSSGQATVIVQSVESARRVRVATTGNIADLAAGAPATVDTIGLAPGDRVLVWQQSLLPTNGIYVVDFVGTGSDGSWSRAKDFDESFEVLPGTLVVIAEGPTYGDKIPFLVISDGVIDVGTDDLEFAQIPPGTPANHALGGSSHTIDTIANLNSKISDGVVDDENAPRATVAEVSALGFATTTSATFVLLPSMTISPAAAEYYVVFAGTFGNAAAGVSIEDIEIQVFVGGVAVADTIRTVTSFGAAAVTHGITIGKITVAAAEAVEIRWRSSTGATLKAAAQRKLSLLETK